MSFHKGVDCILIQDAGFSLWCRQWCVWMDLVFFFFFLFLFYFVAYLCTWFVHKVHLRLHCYWIVSVWSNKIFCCFKIKHSTVYRYLKLVSNTIKLEECTHYITGLFKFTCNSHPIYSHLYVNTIYFLIIIINDISNK